MAKTKRAKLRALKRRRATAKIAAAATGVGAVPKRRRCESEEDLMETLRREHAERHPRLPKGETCGFSERNASKRRFGVPTKIEFRTGGGVKVRMITNGRGFGGTPGVIRQSSGCCNPAIHHCMDSFYGQIDHDLEVWQFREDLKLRVPYAVREWKLHMRKVSLLWRDAKRRGVV